MVVMVTRVWPYYDYDDYYDGGDDYRDDNLKWYRNTVLKVDIPEGNIQIMMTLMCCGDNEEYDYNTDHDDEEDDDNKTDDGGGSYDDHDGDSGGDDDHDDDDGIIPSRNLFSGLHFVSWHHFNLLEEVFKAILDVCEHLQSAVNQTSFNNF